jgi:hypothetical protein
MGHDPNNVCQGSEITNSLNAMQPLGISSTQGNIAIKNIVSVIYYTPTTNQIRYKKVLVLEQLNYRYVLVTTVTVIYQYRHLSVVTCGSGFFCDK